jgi:hypothetical protein
MLNYLVFGIAIIIFATVIIISGKAISDIEENGNISNPNSSLIDQINDLNKLKEQGIISDEEFKKAKDKILN